MAERFVYIEEVVGSTPTSSTSQTCPPLAEKQTIFVTLYRQSNTKPAYRQAGSRQEAKNNHTSLQEATSHTFAAKSVAKACLPAGKHRDIRKNRLNFSSSLA